jgi:hypothetical protein
LKAPGVRSEVAVGDAAKHLLPGKESDPQILQLKQLENLNPFYCHVLTSNGFDGGKLKTTSNAPTRKNYVAITEPHSQARVDAIKKAKSAGGMFYATGGRHLNSDKFFKAQETKMLEDKLKKMEKAKGDHAAYCIPQGTKRRHNAVEVKR